MGSASINLIALPPDPSELLKVIAKFSKGGGIVTAFDDMRIALVRDLGYDDTLVELLPFGKVMGGTLNRLGIRTMDLPTQGQSRGAVQLACEELDEDSEFYPCKDFPGFHEVVVDCLKELRHWGISLEALDRAAQAAKPPYKSRLQALLEVELVSTQTLETLGKVSSSRRAEAIFEVEAVEKPNFDRLLVLAGADFFPTELRCLQRLAELGMDITLVVERSTSGFEGAKLTADYLGQELKTSKIERWTDHLFGDTSSPTGPEALIFSAADVLSECEWALRLCQEEYSSGKAQEHRIVIWVSDPEKYIPLLIASGKRFDIKLNAPIRVPLLSNGFASLVLIVLELLAESDLRWLSRAISSTYLWSDNDAKARLLDHVSDWRSRGLEPWAMLEEYADANRSELPWLWPLLAWRKRALSAQRTLTEWHGMLDDMLRLDLLERAAQDTDSGKREQDFRAQGGLMRAVVDYAPSYDSRHRRTLSFAEFVGLARSLWEREQIVLPSSRNGFRVISDPSMIGEADVVVALGMLEGSLPKRRTEDPVLSDEHREHLHELLPEYPALLDSFYQAREERDKLVRICIAARKKLILGYPQTSEDRDNVPTSYLEEIKRVLPKVEEVDFPHRLFVPELEKCRLPADLNLREAFEDPVREPLTNVLTTDSAKNLVRPNLQEGLEISEVVSAAKCPFQSVARYRLGLSARRFELGSRLRRLPVRANLLAQPSAVAARAAFQSEVDKLIADEFVHRESWELTLAEAGSQRLIQGWLEREFDARARWGLGPVKTVVSLGEPELNSEFKLDRTTIRFSGRVDGVSDHPNGRVLHFVRHSAFPNDSDLESDWLELGLYFWSATRSSLQFAGFDYSIPDARQFLYFDERPSHAPHNLGLNVRAVPLNLDKRALGEVTKRVLRRVLAELQTGDMRPVPGDHCRTCDLGELCRVSSVYVDIDDYLAESANGEHELNP